MIARAAVISVECRAMAREPGAFEGLNLFGVVPALEAIA